MSDTLEQRVDALERALTDGRTADVDGLSEAAELAERLDELEATVETIDDRVAELEAGVQALRGFVGGVDAVDEAVERRANAAIARVERLETEVREGRAEAGTLQPDPGRGDDDTSSSKRDESAADGRMRRDDGRPAANRAPTDAARSVGHEHGGRTAPADGEVDAGRNDRNPHDSTGVGRHAGANEPPVSTLAAAAADTARTELASEPAVSDEEREPAGGATEADTTLAERVRRLL
ncbi:DUF7310 family coiled-coil domain-containing protein [Haloplanus ruber]|uniref:DUF7310 domain-containing protein n=1 Tax=Haloplanus ruber TaxID=869892 RepID=A0ABD6D0X4_9EURY|nr:hypothetical protein [Haloplanus ruber]